MTFEPVKAWRCTVCGYIHREGEPPDECPVCGAPRSDFEPYKEKPSEPPRSVAKSWRCTVCGYEHSGISPPDECPQCGAPRDSFEPVFEEETPVRAVEGALRLVIAGGGIAGVSAAEAARKTSPDAAITLVTKEDGLPYYRLNLTRLLAGELNEEALPIHDAAWYEERRIRVLTGAEVAAISLDPKQVQIRDGRSVAFDRLILAAGAHAFLPVLPGIHHDGVFSLRSLEDARALLAGVRPGVRCVCIGGGILGLETAGALAKRKARVTLLEGHDYLMPRQLCRRAGEIVGDFVSSLGITLLTQARTKEIAGEGRVGQVRLEDGSALDADMVVVTTGVRSNTYLAREANLAVKNGVLVDNHLRASHPDIWAAGDVAEHAGVLYGSWYAAQFQGSIAGMNAAGGDVEFGGIPRSHTLKVLGLDMTSVGLFEPPDASYDLVEEEQGRAFRRLVFRDARLVGGILLGDTRGAAGLAKAIEKKTDFSAFLAGSPTPQGLLDQLGQLSL